MRLLASAILLLTLSFGNPLVAQTIFPPPALKTAQTLEAAFTALNAGRPELSTYLLLDVPDIAIPGSIHGRVRSEIPGTTYLVVLRGIPTAADDPKFKPKPARASLLRPRGTAPAAAPSAPPQQPTTLLLAAERVEPDRAASLTFDFRIERNEKLTMLAFAQGRWFAAVREIKVGRLADASQ